MLCNITPEQLAAYELQVNSLERMGWDMNTDLNAAFQLVLDRACAADIPPEQMLDTIFIFSDMQFDQAVGGQWVPGVGYPTWEGRKTNYQKAKDDFAQHGYKLPKVVFWNLRGPNEYETASVPVTCTEEGTALVSGFSGQLLKLFMGGIDELKSYNPFNVMQQAISADKYNGWRVVD